MYPEGPLLGCLSLAAPEVLSPASVAVFGTLESKLPGKSHGAPVSGCERRVILCKKKEGSVALVTGHRRTGVARAWAGGRLGHVFRME